MDGGTDITEVVIGSAIAVHRALGPGLLESTYEACLVYELLERGMAVERQKSLPVDYRGVRIDCGYRIDLLVGNAVIVELKAVERVLPVHEAQLLTYLRLSGHRVGLLLNFRQATPARSGLQAARVACTTVPLMKDGIKRMVHEPGRQSSS